MREDLVDDTELQRFLGLEESVSVHRLFDVGQALAGILDVEVVHPGADAQDFLGLDLDVRSHAARTARWLVDHDPCVRKRDAHARLACREQEAAHRRGLAHAHGADLRLDVLHGIVDRHSGCHHAARRVDVHRDVLAVLAFEEQQLSDDQRGHLVLDFAGHENDTLAQQAAEDVEAALAAAGAFHHHGHERAGHRIGVELALGAVAPADAAEHVDHEIPLVLKRWPMSRFTRGCSRPFVRCARTFAARRHRIGRAGRAGRGSHGRGKAQVRHSGRTCGSAYFFAAAFLAAGFFSAAGFSAAGFFSALAAAGLAAAFLAGFASSSLAAAFFAGAFSAFSAFSALAGFPSLADFSAFAGFSALSASSPLAAAFLAVFFGAAFFFSGSAAEAPSSASIAASNSSRVTSRSVISALPNRKSTTLSSYSGARSWAWAIASPRTYSTNRSRSS